MEVGIYYVNIYFLWFFPTVVPCRSSFGVGFFFFVKLHIRFVRVRLVCGMFVCMVKQTITHNKAVLPRTAPVEVYCGVVRSARVCCPQ